MATLSAADPVATTGSPWLDTARVTGLLYLGVGIAGAVGFLVVRPLLFTPDDPAGTLTTLVEREGLARAGIGLDLLLVVTQALAALWFFKLFRAVDAFAAGTIAVFGMVNSVAILGSAAMTATALQVAGVAGAAGTTGSGDPHLLYQVSENFWGVGNLFFGLWLIPMGWCALRTAAMPRALGWILVGGGAGYVLSAFTGYLLPDAGALTGALVIPATIGEVWMIGHLLVRGDGGVRPRTP